MKPFSARQREERAIEPEGAMGLMIAIRGGLGRRTMQALVLLPRWSSLRLLGQSRLLALSALVPVLGSLLLFNEQIVDFLLLSPKIVAKWLGAIDSVEASRSLTFDRLYFLYFGLSFLGLASFGFRILCPTEIQQHATSTSYVETEKPYISRPRIPLLVRATAEDFLRHNPQSESNAFRAKFLSWYDTLAYPHSLISYFWEVFEDVTEAVDWPDATSGQEDGIGIRAGAQWNIQVDRVAYLVTSRLQVFRGFWTKFDEEAEQYIVDLLALRHQALDHARPISRIIVSLLYASGFLVLFYPTVTTFWLIIRRVVP